jgi:hypothetical protein
MCTESTLGAGKAPKSGARRPIEIAVLGVSPCADSVNFGKPPLADSWRELPTSYPVPAESLPLAPGISSAIRRMGAALPRSPGSPLPRHLAAPACETVIAPILAGSLGVRLVFPIK